ncbi:DNA polymerase II large subunit [Candidatus Marsarchaeota archaeon]|nr:DNA polymerase II large subunit [Candidatus Marsarchaeota archaeon]
MDIDEYANIMASQFDNAYSVAKEARAKGYDPKEVVEIYPAPDLASRVEGLINVTGLADIIRSLNKGQSRSRLAFNVVENICKGSRFDGYDMIKRLELAVRVGSAILTEGILVAPTEGITGIRRYRNSDGTDYIAILYAGPIRGAGGTAAALSVALADYARRIFNIGKYKPTSDEIERYVEDVDLYHTRAARLQYRPPDDDLRVIVSNCPICVDGVPSETIEVGVHANLKRIGYDNKEVPLSNRVRGGVALVLCEGIAQKAKKLLREVKPFGLDWDWINGIIKVDVKRSEQDKPKSTFLDELVAGRPILAYPGYVGGFRLRYGRSRMTGIASKGFSPATMIIAMGFIAVGTQLKMEIPGKGCIAVPVDSIEGPFVRLKTGEALRINDARTAMEQRNNIAKILSLGDILITFGDFRKANSQLKPTSYVEELWEKQVRKAGFGSDIDHTSIDFENAFALSIKYSVPIHPKFLFEFQALSKSEIIELAMHIIRNSRISGKSVYELEGMELGLGEHTARYLELLNVEHKLLGDSIHIPKDHARSLLCSLGFVNPDGSLKVNEIVVDEYDNQAQDAISMLGKVAPFSIPKRSTYIGARIGRPEKAKERLMRPAPNVLFPIGNYGGRDRNITSAYINCTKRFRPEITVELEKYVCPKCKRTISSQVCYDCGVRAVQGMFCTSCKTIVNGPICKKCGSDPVLYEGRNVDLTKLVTEALKKSKTQKLPNVMKGVKGMGSRDKPVEQLEKGILRALNGVYVFKDGTSRFDATDVPITHFYPAEIGVSADKLRELGYDVDIKGNRLEDEHQLIEMRHQDVILNMRGAEYMLKISRFVDMMLERLYGMKPFYNAERISDMVGKQVITLSPHTSCAVLGRIIGFTDANVGFAHPYTISARRRNCDGDEDTTMLLLDALINFSREYLPQTVGGTMDTPLILSVNIKPEEVDDEVHAMEIVDSYPLEFYEKTYSSPAPSEIKMECVESRLGGKDAYGGIMFTHNSSDTAIVVSPKKSTYTILKTMQEKLDAEFELMDKLESVDIKDAARKVILSHFIPDLIGNMHSFSRQIFRCIVCNAKYRRVPLSGVCQRDGGKLLLTISKGSIEKYLNMAINLAERYNLDNYIKRLLYLIKEEINDVFGGIGTAGTETPDRQQFSLLKFV